MIYAYLIGFSLLFGYYNAWQWVDEQDGVYDPRKAKGRWKGASVVLRAWAAAAPIVFSLVGFEVADYALAAAISLPVFDLTINIVKGMPVFYLGTTSKTDKLGKWKWIAYAALIVALALIKIFL